MTKTITSISSFAAPTDGDLETLKAMSDAERRKLLKEAILNGFEGPFHKLDQELSDDLWGLPLPQEDFCVMNNRLF